MVDWSRLNLLLFFLRYKLGIMKPIAQRETRVRLFIDGAEKQLLSNS